MNNVSSFRCFPSDSKPFFPNKVEKGIVIALIIIGALALGVSAYLKSQGIDMPGIILQGVGCGALLGGTLALIIRGVKNHLEDSRKAPSSGKTAPHVETASPTMIPSSVDLSKYEFPPFIVQLITAWKGPVEEAAWSWIDTNAFFTLHQSFDAAAGSLSSPMAVGFLKGGEPFFVIIFGQKTFDGAINNYLLFTRAINNEWKHFTRSDAPNFKLKLEEKSMGNLLEVVQRPNEEVVLSLDPKGTCKVTLLTRYEYR